MCTRHTGVSLGEASLLQLATVNIDNATLFSEVKGHLNGHPRTRKPPSERCHAHSQQPAVTYADAMAAGSSFPCHPGAAVQRLAELWRTC